MEYQVTDLINSIAESFKCANITKITYAQEKPILDVVANQILEIQSSRDALKSNKTLHITGDEFADLFDGCYTSSPNFTVTENYADEGFIDEHYDGEIPDRALNVLKKLIGFTIDVTAKGEHVHDGTDVPYRIVFTSPTGLKTIVNTTGNLCVGIRCEPVNLKL